MSKLELRTAYGPVFRDVLDTPPRDCTASEIPIIDVSPLYSAQLSDRKALAGTIRAAAVNTGFFYIRNHGIPEETIDNAKKQLLRLVRVFLALILILNLNLRLNWNLNLSLEKGIYCGE